MVLFIHAASSLVVANGDVCAQLGRSGHLKFTLPPKD